MTVLAYSSFSSAEVFFLYTIFPEDSVGYRLEVNEKIRAVAPKIAEDYGCVFVPLYDKIYENAKRSRIEYFMWDGTHPSIAGHMLIAEEWLNALDKS